MSFLYDPYRVVTIVQLPDGTVSAWCPSCGRIQEAHDPNAPIRSPFIDMRVHLADEHGLTPAGTAHWSVPVVS